MNRNKHAERTRWEAMRHSPLGVIRSQICEFRHQGLELKFPCGAVLHPDGSILEAILAEWYDQLLGSKQQRISTELVGLS